jgi:Domain of unknown function (DUF4143)
LKGRYNLGERSNLFFWKHRSGREVDVVIDTAEKLIPIEVKSGRTVTSDSFRGLDSWMRISGEASAKPSAREDRRQVREQLDGGGLDGLNRHGAEDRRAAHGPEYPRVARTDWPPGMLQERLAAQLLGDAKAF